MIRINCSWERFVVCWSTQNPVILYPFHWRTCNLVRIIVYLWLPVVKKRCPWFCAEMWNGPFMAESTCKLLTPTDSFTRWLWRLRSMKFLSFLCHFPTMGQEVLSHRKSKWLPAPQTIDSNDPHQNHFLWILLYFCTISSQYSKACRKLLFQL